MIAIEPHPQGAVLPVRARAGARRNEIGGEQNGALKVSVTQVAEKGKANKAILALLARGLDLKKSQLELIAGETSREKRFLVREISPHDLQERIGRTPHETT
jgi:hypothetical protein